MDQVTGAASHQFHQIMFMERSTRGTLSSTW